MTRFAITVVNYTSDCSTETLHDFIVIISYYLTRTTEKRENLTKPREPLNTTRREFN